MHTGPERGARVNLDEQLAFMFLWNVLPCGLNQNIVYRKRLKVLLPIINPIFVLRLRYGNGAFPHIHKQAQPVQPFFDLA